MKSCQLYFYNDCPFIVPNISTFCAPIIMDYFASTNIIFFTCSAAGTLDQKHSAFSSSEDSVLPQSVNKPYDSAPDGRGHKEEVSQGGTHGPSISEKASATAIVTSSQAQRAVKDNSKAHSTSTSTNSVIGVYSSSSDPVHVPSPASRSAGTVGAIRREVGVVGVRKQPSNHPASNSSVPNSSFSVPLLGKDVSLSSRSFGQTVATSKSSQLNQSAASEPTVPSMAASRSSSASQYNAKTHQQPVGHQKGNIITDFLCACVSLVFENEDGQSVQYYIYHACLLYTSPSPRDS